MNTLQGQGPLVHGQAVSTEPPTQIQQELHELRGITGELEQGVQDLWVRLGTVVLPPIAKDRNPPTPGKDGGVQLANELREIVLRLNDTSGSIRVLRQAIQL